MAARLRALVAEGACAYRDIAVLLRTSALVRLYEKTLREQGVPCEVTEGRGFYDAREVNDLVDDDTLLRLKMTHGSLIEGVERELGPLYERLLRFRTRRDYTTLDRLLGRLLSETGYETWLLEQPNGAHAVANVRKLLALARLHSIPRTAAISLIRSRLAAR